MIREDPARRRSARRGCNPLPIIFIFLKRCTPDAPLDIPEILASFNGVVYYSEKMVLNETVVLCYVNIRGEKVMAAKRFTTAEITAMIVRGDLSSFYNSRAWRHLSHDVIRKHNNECYLCRKIGKVSIAIITHHVQELKKRPDLAYSIDNLIPLCFECHESIHQRGLYAVSKKFENPERW